LYALENRSAQPNLVARGGGMVRNGTEEHDTLAEELVDTTEAKTGLSKARGERSPGTDTPTLAAAISRWQYVAALAASAALLGFAYAHSNLFGFWWGKWMEKDSYYSHGVLVPLISAFTVYLDRRTLAQLPVSPGKLGLAILIPCGLLAIVARSANVLSILGLTLPIMLYGAVWFLMGPKVARRMLFPIGFLFFMCVLPGQILTQLSFKIQLLSTTGASLMLKLIGQQPNQTGAMITLPNAQVLVGQPCSGFRLLISLSAFAVFFAYMREGPRWGKVLLVLATAPLSLLVNSIRIFMIAMVGEYFGSEAMHAFHDYSGYLVLILAFVVLWQLSKVVQCRKFKAVLVG